MFHKRLLNVHHHSRTICNYACDLLLQCLRNVQCLRNGQRGRIVDIFCEEFENDFERAEFPGNYIEVAPSGADVFHEGYDSERGASYG